MTVKQEEMKLRNDLIIEYLKETKRPVSGKEIEDLTGMKRETRRRYMQILSEKNRHVVTTTNLGHNNRPVLAYTWHDDINKACPKKNPEGYSDPTPERAINVEEKLILPVAGETWATIESSGVNGMIFVLNAISGAAQCMKIFHDTSENRAIIDPDPFRIVINGVSYIGDPTRSTFKPLKYCIRRCKKADNVKLTEARKMVAEALGIDSLTPEVVEKEVIKEVKVPVEVEKVVYKDKPANDIPDDYIDCKSAQIAILTEQRDIWKEVATALLSK